MRPLLKLVLGRGNAPLNRFGRTSLKKGDFIPNLQIASPSRVISYANDYVHRLFAGFDDDLLETRHAARSCAACIAMRTKSFQNPRW